MAPVITTRKKRIKVQAKATVTPRWAWAFISSGFCVSDAEMGSKHAMVNKIDEAPPLGVEILGVGKDRR